MKKKLRILTITHMYPREDLKRHGIFICREAEYLAKYGVECDFLVARPWAPWPLYHIPRWRTYGPANPLSGPANLTARQARYFRTPGFAFRVYEGRSMARGLIRQARRWHAEKPFDTVLGISMNPDAEAAVIIGKKLRLPVACLAVGSDVMVYTKRLRKLWKHLGRILEQTDLPVGVSESICQKLAETGKCKRQPLCVYLGRDTNEFSPPKDKSKLRRDLRWADQDIVAVYVGALFDTKGMNELVPAAEGLLREYADFKLACVGNGPAMRKLIELRKRLGRDDAVVLPGQAPPEDVPLYLKAADFMVLPSHSEGMPQAVLEAMNCGLPVVATRVGGIPEAVIDGKTGILVDAKNARWLTDAMERMIKDREFRLGAGQEALAHVRKKFDPDQNAEKFAKALWSLAQHAC